MNEKVKALLQELGEAINESVTGSARIEQIMQVIRDSGYEVYLMLEANIAVEDKIASAGKAADPYEGQLTTEDKKFLQRLKIQY